MEHTSTDEIGEILAGGLGSMYAVLKAKDCIAVVSPEFGVATVAGDERTASDAALRITGLARALGIEVKAKFFAVSAVGGSDNLVRPGPAMSVDVLAAMTRPGNRADPIGDEKAALLVETLRTVEKPPAGQSRKPPQLSRNLLRLLENGVRKGVGGDAIWISGMQVDVKEAVSPNFLLPAILYTTAVNWTLPVVASGGKGGFEVRLAKDDNAILGYKVEGLEASSPLLLMIGVVNTIKRCSDKHECFLDPCVEDFAAFLDHIGADSHSEDVDVRIVASTPQIAAPQGDVAVTFAKVGDAIPVEEKV